MTTTGHWLEIFELSGTKLATESHDAAWASCWELLRPEFEHGHIITIPWAQAFAAFPELSPTFRYRSFGADVPARELEFYVERKLVDPAFVNPARTKLATFSPILLSAETARRVLSPLPVRPGLVDSQSYVLISEDYR